MYPITYEADYKREPSRLSTFFRFILMIPWIIVGYVYFIALAVTVLISWFAILITGRYPQGLYNFNAGVLRYSARANSFGGLLTDEFPPFGTGTDPTYPVRVQVAPRPEKQSRLKAFFRMILAIPLFFVAYAINFIHLGGIFISWLTIVFRGYQPAGAHNALLFTTAWQTRVGAYILLLTDIYPPVGDEAPSIGDVRSAGQPALAGSAAPPAPAGEPATEQQRRPAE
ncbi:MAG TPA: DUF4389 domain-containing protein [Solirubrobacterales bacterium]|nr:DUF4389 domain-containing protein [Solirubrobacterales bacterium]